MKAYDYILSKQIHWAKDKGIPLIEGKGKKGRLTYTATLNLNLFEKLEPFARYCFKRVDGSELFSKDGNTPKIQTVHSSSALAINIFHYWQRITQVPTIAAACGFCRKGSEVSQRIVFEEKYPIEPTFRYNPNINVVILNAPLAKYKRFAIECKFSEAYGGQGHGGLKQPYLEINELWEDIPTLRMLAESISPSDEQFSTCIQHSLFYIFLVLKNNLARKVLGCFISGMTFWEKRESVIERRSKLSQISLHQMASSFME